MRVDKLSIIIPWRGGDSLREKALCELMMVLNTQEYDTHRGYEILIVRHQAEDIPMPELPGTYELIDLKTDRPEFNKAWCMNVAARKASTDHLLFLDADTLFYIDYLQSVFLFLESLDRELYQNIAIAWDNMAALPGRDNPDVRYIKPWRTRALGGCWYAYRPFFFEKFGGMNEDYWGYGGEDNEAYERSLVAMKINRRKRVPLLRYTVMHQYHHWASQSPRALVLLDKSKRHLKVVSDRLCVVGVGDITGPKTVETEKLG